MLPVILMGEVIEERMRRISERFSELEAGEMKSRLGRLLALDLIRTVGRSSSRYALRLSPTRKTGVTSVFSEF